MQKGFFLKHFSASDSKNKFLSLKKKRMHNQDRKKKGWWMTDRKMKVTVLKEKQQRCFSTGGGCKTWKMQGVEKRGMGSGGDSFPLQMLTENRQRCRQRQVEVKGKRREENKGWMPPQRVGPAPIERWRRRQR